MKLVIDRSKWLRGEKNGRLIRTADSKMCCLGFYGLACGVPEHLMKDNGEPCEAFDHATGETAWPKWMGEPVKHGGHGDDADYYFSQQNAVEKLIEANDGDSATEADREAEIARLFALHGVEVEFVDGEAP